MKKSITISTSLLVSCFLLPGLSKSQTQSFSGGGQHSLFLCSNNNAMSTGLNPSGQLGDGTNNNTIIPVNVNSLNGITKVFAGYSHSLFLKNDGTAWACGENGYGQLGDSTIVNKNSPVQVFGISGISTFAGAQTHSVFVKNDNTVWACGYNGYGQLGDGTFTQRLSPVQLTTLSGITDVATGTQHTVFLKNDNTVWACGTNYSGQFGDGTTNDSPVPVQSGLLNGITAIAAGESQTLFLKNDSTVWVSGYNFYGQLGTGTNTNVTTPVQISLINKVIAIASGKDHSLFLKSDGTVWACGYNGYGQLGDGTNTDKWTPVQISSLSGITSIAAGQFHSFFMKNDGTIWACGQNGYGQLGDSTTVDRWTPVQITYSCPPPPVASFTLSSDTICVNGCINFTDSSTNNPTSWNWDFGNGNVSTLQHPSNCYNIGGTYPVRLITSNPSGSDTAYMNVVVNNYTDISGIVSFSTGNVAGGNVFLIAQGASSALYDTIATVSADLSGMFIFAGAAVGNYYVRAEANAVIYPTLVNTYFGNSYLWDSAAVITHGCSVADSANILMNELPVISGPGTISGTVSQGAGFGQKIIPGNPVPYTNAIPGVPVKVGRNPSGTIVASGSTDTNGVYTFSNLPLDDYTIYVDIPGYPMDSTYHVSITSTSDSIVNLDYIVDSNSVYIDLTTSVLSNRIAIYRDALTVYPNPVNDNVTFVFDVCGGPSPQAVNSNVKIELYNLQGEKIAVLLDGNFEKGKYNHIVNFDQSAISTGTYMVKTNINNNNSCIRLVVIK